MIRTSLALAAAATLGLATSASATVLFTDGFEAEALGAPVLSLINFNIIGPGNVDVVGPANPFGITTTSKVVDLDGTPGPGKIISKQSFAFNAGDRFTLSFLLGGAQRGSAGDDAFVDLLFGGSTTISNVVGTGLFSPFSGTGGTGVEQILDRSGIVGTTPFTASSVSFTTNTAGSLKFGFGSNSADNVGPLLDNVQLSVVPEPASWAMMIAGFGLAGAMLRRRRTAAAAA